MFHPESFSTAAFSTASWVFAGAVLAQQLEVLRLICAITQTVTIVTELE